MNNLKINVDDSSINRMQCLSFEYMPTERSQRLFLLLYQNNKMTYDLSFFKGQINIKWLYVFEKQMVN
jgi:hypothetical protein